MTITAVAWQSDAANERLAEMLAGFRRLPEEANATGMSYVVSRGSVATLGVYLVSWSARWPERKEAGNSRLEITGSSFVSHTWPIDTTTAEVPTDSMVEQLDVMMPLEAAAKLGDEQTFQSTISAIDWETQPTQNIMKAIRLAIAVGAPLVARKLAADGARHYPEHSELQKAARVLAPPRVIGSVALPEPGMPANLQWLADHRDEYQGQWVALKDGQLLGAAPLLEDVVQIVGNPRGKGILVTVVY